MRDHIPIVGVEILPPIQNILDCANTEPQSHLSDLQLSPIIPHLADNWMNHDEKSDVESMLSFLQSAKTASGERNDVSKEFPDLFNRPFFFHSQLLLE